MSVDSKFLGSSTPAYKSQPERASPNDETRTKDVTGWGDLAVELN